MPAKVSGEGGLTGDARHVDLLDGVLVHEFLQAGLGFFVALLVVHFIIIIINDRPPDPRKPRPARAGRESAAAEGDGHPVQGQGQAPAGTPGPS